jgi:hypothetical protein
MDSMRGKMWSMKIDWPIRRWIPFFILSAFIGVAGGECVRRHQGTPHQQADRKLMIEALTELAEEIKKHKISAPTE